MQSLKFTVQVAKKNNSKAIKKLIDFYSYKNALLAKSEENIREEIDSFFIVTLPKNYKLEEIQSEKKNFTFAKAILAGSTMSASQSHKIPEPPPLTKVDVKIQKNPIPKKDNNFQDNFEAQNDIMGTIAVKKFNDKLFEIRSFAVWPRFQNLSIGNLLLQKALDSIATGRIFTLTFIPLYFKKYGFQKINKLSLPEKIWEDCLSCSFKNDCNETAMELSKI